MDAVATIERQRNAEREKWLSALVLGAFAMHSLLFFQFSAGDVIMFVRPWYEHIIANGRIGVFGEPFSNYTPPYLYLLSASSLFDGLLPTYYIIKLLSWVGAIWLIFAAYRLLQALKSTNPVLALAVILLPSIAANVSMLGQADTFWAAPCVLALAAAVRGRWFWVAFWSGLAFAFKAQAAFFAPFVLHLFVTRRVSWKIWIVAPAVYVAAMFPAWLAGWPAWDLATIYLRQALWQPDVGYFISNGASWWTIYGWLLPSLALRTFWVGFALALAAVLASLIYLPALSRRKMLIAAIVSAAGIPFLIPGMHERFYLLGDVLAFIYAIAYPSRRSIVAAVLMQVASALPVYVWAFQAEPAQLVAPPLAAIALWLLLKEFVDPAELRQGPRVLTT